MGTLVDDARVAADWIASALNSSGYAADFTLESLKEIDRFFDEHARNGQALPNGLLNERLGSRLFALGSYVGEVIRRACGGSWRGDDTDSNGEINIELVMPNGAVLWPVQRVMKRFENGPEDGIYVYGFALSRNVTGSGSNEGGYQSTPSSLRKPWWRFW